MTPVLSVSWRSPDCVPRSLRGPTTPTSALQPHGLLSSHPALQIADRASLPPEGLSWPPGPGHTLERTCALFKSTYPRWLVVWFTSLVQLVCLFAQHLAPWGRRLMLLLPTVSLVGGTAFSSTHYTESTQTFVNEWKPFCFNCWF